MKNKVRHQKVNRQVLKVHSAAAIIIKAAKHRWYHSYSPILPFASANDATDYELAKNA
ncbi:MAG: hypothetical protein KDD45_07285 [Bdellovibrionales bacterium]|nr:hypothetical protein [Bdellovibrionales bacterium]